MNQNQIEQPNQGVRTPRHLPLCTIDDAGNLANHYLNLYLESCRAVTAGEALDCIGVMVARAKAVESALTEQHAVSPETDHGHDHGPVALDGGDTQVPYRHAENADA